MSDWRPWPPSDLDCTSSQPLLTAHNSATGEKTTTLLRTVAVNIMLVKINNVWGKEQCSINNDATLLIQSLPLRSSIFLGPSSTYNSVVSENKTYIRQDKNTI